MKKIGLILLGLLLSACSTSKSDMEDEQSSTIADTITGIVGITPTPPNDPLPNLPPKNRALPPLQTSANFKHNVAQGKYPLPSQSSRFNSIMAQNGAVLTLWALAPRNWLWGYAPLDSLNFGNIRNWRVEPVPNQPEHFRFINQQLASCVEAYGNGLIHNSCNQTKLSQAFLLIPTTSGAVMIKNVQQGRCVTYNPVSSQNYTTITLSNCTAPFRNDADQAWYLTPPLLPATPQIAH